MRIARVHVLTTNNGAAVLKKKIEYLQLKSVTDNRYAVCGRLKSAWGKPELLHFPAFFKMFFTV